MHGHARMTLRWPCVADIAWSVRSFQYGRSCDAPTSSWGVLRYQRQCSQLVFIIPECSPIVRSKRICKVDAYCLAVWLPTRLGPRSDPFPVVHGIPTGTSGVTWVTTTSLYQRHSNLWFLSSWWLWTAPKSRVSVRQWRWFMDAVEQAAAQHGENGSIVVCVGLSAAAYSRRTVDGGYGPCSTSPFMISPWSWYLPWFRTYQCVCTSHECVQFFRGSATDL